MQFQNVQSALVTALGNDAAGRFRTIGYKDQEIGQNEIVSNDKLVSVYYSKGSLNESRSGRNGPADHECSFNIELKLSQPAKVDISTLEDSGSTDNERKIALAALQDAKNLANSNLDDFINIIFGILTDNRNSFLGLSKNVFANRWISNIQKEDPMYFGDSLICSATLTYTCDVIETFIGDSGSSGDVIDLTMKLNEESTAQTGVYKED